MKQLANGTVRMTRREFDALLEYSTSLPTGTTPGKQWKRAVRPWMNKPHDEWRLGQYGEPYPEGHEHHGQIPIFWFHISVEGVPPRFPAIWVPPAPMRGRSVDAPCGWQEGDLCMRDLCLGVLELRRDYDLGGCTCWQHAPCSSCLSHVPECPECGHREPEPY